MLGCRASSVCASLWAVGTGDIGHVWTMLPSTSRMMATAMDGELSHLAGMGCTSRQPH